jgi:hypothetical protein
MKTCTEPRKCSRCGNYLGEMITTEIGGASVTVLRAGGMNICDLNKAECAKIASVAGAGFRFYFTGHACPHVGQIAG